MTNLIHSRIDTRAQHFADAFRLRKDSEEERDRFFLFFAASFWIESINRVALGLWANASETNPVFYSIRLVSYSLILLAIWQKNRPRS